MTQATASSRVDELRDRLLERDVTYDEVCEYITLQHAPHTGQTPQSLPNFIDPQDIQRFWALYDWWEPVKDKPSNVATPTISQFCWYINTPHNTPPTTFLQALTIFHQRAIAWCDATGLNHAHPGETAAQRKRRLNRERMAKVRVHRATPKKVLEQNHEVADEVLALEARCEELRIESKAADDWAKAEVVKHQQAMIAAAANRKKLAADFKTQIENLRTEIRTLIKKQ